MMRRGLAPLVFSLLLAVMLAVFLQITVAQEKSSGEETRTIATAPSGAFRLQWQKQGPLQLVPKGDQAKVINLPAVRVVTRQADDGVSSVDPREVSSDELPGVPLAFISPNNQWIYVMQGADFDRTIGYLYRRENESEYRLATAERLDTLAQRFLSKEENVPEPTIAAITDKQIRKGRAEFVAWSPDSTRLLLHVSGWLDDWTPEKGGTRVPGEARFCYYNTGTNQFELTERLRRTNTLSQTKRMHISKEEEEVIASWPLDAESQGEEKPVSPIRERFTRTDRRLNEVYGKLLAKVPAAQREAFRQEQREWLLLRDTAAAAHIAQTWGILRKAREVEGLAIATEARVAELEKRLQP